jgi:hypothetical protein
VADAREFSPLAELVHTLSEEGIRFQVAGMSAAVPVRTLAPLPGLGRWGHVTGGLRHPANIGQALRAYWAGSPGLWAGSPGLWGAWTPARRFLITYVTH